MGPEYGTDAYRKQVETIVTALDIPMLPSELPSFLMLYITDPTFSRAAICEAEKKLMAKLTQPSR